MNDRPDAQELRYLRLLSRQFPNIAAASTEIINLQAILNLPKGTEHFMSDIHGEDEAFLHILSNASGEIKNKIDLIYSNTLSLSERRALATLIYYPEHRLEQVEASQSSEELRDWYRVTLHRLVELCRHVSGKYTRSKVRKALPHGFEYILDELLHIGHDASEKAVYYENIMDTIIDIDRASAFIVALCGLIKRLLVDRLHIVGDIFDRGPHADVIMERLLKHHCVDIEWGNHDILWMGAAAGSHVCIATVLNNSMRYNNLDIVEDGYGVNLLPLALFAQDVYTANANYTPKVSAGTHFEAEDLDLLTKMHKAMLLIQFKLECQLIRRHPEYNMDDRKMLERINYDNMTITLDAVTHPLRDTDFPTVDPAQPYALTDAEQILMRQLCSSFVNSEKLQRHARFLYDSGSLYRCHNGNLLFHGCLPTNADGTRMQFSFDGRKLSGKTLFDYSDAMARQGYFAPPGSAQRSDGMDYLWFLWCGRHSPLFGRSCITTFERLLVEDRATWVEKKNAYYTHCNDADFCRDILAEFGIDSPFSHIVNGHIPVKAKDGEGPVKAGGKLIVIDGGFCRAYQSTTGIAGYTMFYSSHGIKIVEHQPFTSRQRAIAENDDILSESVNLETPGERQTVALSDTGVELKAQIEDLMRLLHAYRSGLLLQNVKY